MKIKLTDDIVAKIVIKSLKRDYKETQEEVNSILRKHKKLSDTDTYNLNMYNAYSDSICNVLKYYMTKLEIDDLSLFSFDTINKK